MANGTGKPTLANHCGPDDGTVLVPRSPVVLEQHFEQPAVEPARGAVIDVFRHGVVPKLGVPQAKREAALIASGGFMVEQQG